MVISWKAFWSTLAAVVAFAAAGVAAVNDVSLWFTIPATALVVWLVDQAARLVVVRAEVFADLTERTRDSIAWWITVAAIVHGVAMIAFLIRPDLWALWTATFAALGGATYGVASAQQYLLARPSTTPSRTEVEAQRAESAEAAAADPARANLEGGLEIAGFGWLDVLNWYPIGGDPLKGGAPYGIEADVQVPAKRLTSGGKALAALNSRETCEAIAIGLSEQLGMPLTSDWVTLRKQPEAGRYRLTVLTRDVMADIHPYEDPLQPMSIRTPAKVGYRINGLPYNLLLKQHGQVVGKSTWGKSSLLNELIGFLTLCPDAIVWVGGTQKLYDLVADWLEPYMDTDLPLPIDWVANGQRDTVEMLVAAMVIARWRQALPMNQRGGWPTIVVILDEASFLLGDRVVRVPFEGVPCTASDMVAAHHKGAASGDVVDILVSQRDTMDQWGDKGGDVITNKGWAAGFKTADQGSLGRLLGDYQLPNPRFRGEMLIDGQDGEGITQVKTMYMQPSDPTKNKLHDGPTIREVSWARRNFHTALDAGSAAVAGPAYARRHTRMNAAMLAYLTSSPVAAMIAAGPATSLPVAGPKQEGYELAKQELDALLGPASAAPDRAPAAVSSMVGRVTLAEQILAVVRNAGGPLSRAEIITALAESGRTVKQQVVTNALTALVADGALRRPDKGLYTLAHCDSL